MSTGEYIAVIGASDDAAKYGHKVFAYLLGEGRSVVPIHPNGGTLLGAARYRTIAELPMTPTLVVTVVPPAVTEEIVKQCIARGVPAIWMQPGSESDAAIARARAAGITVTRNACIMLQ